MKRLNIKIDGQIEEKFLADASRNKRGPQAEATYLLERALTFLESESAIYAGKTQIDLGAMRAESAEASR